MQLTNSLVTICANNVLSVTGGDVYISVMTIISSVRQMVETPIYAITEGSSPIISYNYGARRPQKVRQAGITMAVLALIYTLLIWSVILAAPRFLIGIFSSDQALMTDTVPAMKLYFAAFIFMLLQYVGQTIFKALNKKKYAIFFSILRKVIIGAPDLYPALCPEHGPKRRFYGRTRLQCYRRQSLLHCNARHSSPRTETDVTEKRYPHSSTRIPFIHNILIQFCYLLLNTSRFSAPS